MKIQLKIFISTLIFLLAGGIAYNSYSAYVENDIHSFVIRIALSISLFVLGLSYWIKKREK